MPEIKGVRYTHDALIDVILAKPEVSQRELAHSFGFTETWISIIVNSDAFKARLAERKGDLIDPAIIASIEQRLQGLTNLAMSVVEEKLQVSRDPKTAMALLKITSDALGLGKKDNVAVVNNNYVVALPPKEETSTKWLSKFNPMPVLEAQIVENAKA